MKIIFSKKALSIFFRNKGYCCAFFFSLISISFQAQIFQSNNPSLYISEGTIIIEIHNEPNIETAKPINGQFYISENATVSDNQKNIFAKVVFIKGFKIKTSTTKHLAVSKKKQKREKLLIPVVKSNYNFEYPKTCLVFNLVIQERKSISITNNVQLAGIFLRLSKIDYQKIVLEQSVKSFYENEDLHKINGSIFSIRPPPMV